MIKLSVTKDITPEIPKEPTIEIDENSITASMAINKFLDTIEDILLSVLELKKLKAINGEGWTNTHVKAVEAFSCVSTEELILPTISDSMDHVALKKNVDTQLKSIYDRNKRAFKLIMSTEGQDVFGWFFNQFKLSAFYANKLKDLKRTTFSRLDDISVPKFKNVRGSLESFEGMMIKVSALDKLIDDIQHMKGDIGHYKESSIQSLVERMKTPLKALGFSVDPNTLRVMVGETEYGIESDTLGNLDWTPAKVADSIDRIIQLLERNRHVVDVVKDLKQKIEELKKESDRPSPVTLSELNKALLLITSLSKHIIHVLYRLANVYSKLCGVANASR